MKGDNNDHDVAPGHTCHVSGDTCGGCEYAMERDARIATAGRDRDEARALAERYLVMLCNERAKVANLRSALAAARDRLCSVYGIALAGPSVLDLYAQIEAAIESADPSRGGAA